MRSKQTGRCARCALNSLPLTELVRAFAVHFALSSRKLCAPGSTCVVRRRETTGRLDCELKEILVRSAKKGGEKRMRGDCDIAHAECVRENNAGDTRDINEKARNSEYHICGSRTRTRVKTEAVQRPGTYERNARP